MDETSLPAPPPPPAQSSVLPPPPFLPPPLPFGVKPAPRPRNHLRWLIIGVAVVIVGSFLGLKIADRLSTSNPRGLSDIPTRSANLGKSIRVTNPIDVGLTSMAATSVVRGSAATALVGRAEDAVHDRVAVELRVCAGQPFSPNGTVAMFLETSRGLAIFPDPSTQQDSLLNTEFAGTTCKRTILGFTVKTSTRIERFSYLQFPYLRANWKITAPSIGSRS